MIVAGTGHRPPRLGLGYGKDSRARLAAFAKEVLKGTDGVTKVISGMAAGWDQALAHAAIVLRIPLVAAVPFEGQEKRWPDDAQAYYRRLLGRACETVVLAKFYYSAKCFHERDLWMVEHADMMLALYDGRDFEPSGTLSTVRMAEKRGKPVRNVWAEWSSRPV